MRHPNHFANNPVMPVWFLQLFYDGVTTIHHWINKRKLMWRWNVKNMKQNRNGLILIVYQHLHELRKTMRNALAFLLLKFKPCTSRTKNPMTTVLTCLVGDSFQTISLQWNNISPAAVFKDNSDCHNGLSEFHTVNSHRDRRWWFTYNFTLTHCAGYMQLPTHETTQFQDLQFHEFNLAQFLAVVFLHTSCNGYTTGSQFPNLYLW